MIAKKNRSALVKHRLKKVLTRIVVELVLCCFIRRSNWMSAYCNKKVTNIVAESNLPIEGMNLLTVFTAGEVNLLILCDIGFLKSARNKGNQNLNTKINRARSPIVLVKKYKVGVILIYSIYIA